MDKTAVFLGSIIETGKVSRKITEGIGKGRGGRDGRFFYHVRYQGSDKEKIKRHPRHSGESRKNDKEE